MEIYVALLEDRHFDIQIMLFSSKNSAENQVNEWARAYGGRYDFREEKVSAWELYVCADIEDGPNMRIEKHTLDA